MKISPSNFIRLWIVGLLVSSTVYAQKDYYISHYTTKNGLPDNNILGLFYDSDHFLWAPYGNGLLRFDGNNFTSHLTTQTPYISFYLYKTLDNKKIIVDASGYIFQLNSNNKIDTLRKGAVNSLNYLTIKGTLPDINFYLRQVTPHINKSSDKSWQFAPVILFPFTPSSYAVRTKQGIAFSKDNKTEQLNLQNFSDKKFIFIDNNVYFFANDNDIYLIDFIKWKIEKCTITGSILHYKNFSKSIINTFWNYNNSDPCLQLNFDLLSIKIQNNDPLQLTTQLITNELPQNGAITSIIFKEKEQLIFVSTDFNGLYVFKEKRFKTLLFNNPPSGTNNTYFCQLALDSQTVFTDWNREFTISGARKSNLQLNRNYSENIFRDKDSNLLYVDKNDLSIFNPKTKKIKKIKNPTRELILSYSQDGDSIWLGMSKSIACLVNDSIKHIFSIDNNQSNSNILQLQRWDENKLWICNYTGLFKYDPITHQIDTIHELFQQYPYVFNIHEQYMVVGTYGRGYFMTHQGKTVKMPLDKNNYLKQVHAFVFDSLGYLWMATNNGILKTAFSDLKKYFNDTLTTVRFMHYGDEDGIANPEFNGGCDPAFIRLQNGYVSLPNVDGLVWFQPESINDNNLKYKLQLDGIYLNDSLINFTQTSVFPHGSQSIQVNFSAPFWGSVENNFMEYKLIGYSKNWITLNPGQRSVEFSNLPSGSYTFHLRKSTGLAPSANDELSYSFTIQKSFYESRIFILLLIILSILIIISAARLYAFNIKQKNKQLEEKVNQRTIELHKANDELLHSISVKDKLISIISHDIVTPLRFITLVARKSADTDITLDSSYLKTVLSEIKNTTEKLHNNAQNILNWIKHQNNRIQVNNTNVAPGALADEISDQLIDIAASKNTLIINTISHDDIIKSDANILSIVLHNLVSNAIKFTQNGKITISGNEMKSDYIIQITDSGTGMTSDKLQRIRQTLNNQKISDPDPASGKTGYGLGYVIIAELSKLINASIELNSSEGNGTTVTIHLYKLP
jgi:signal transduction histidine kinase